MPKLFIANCTKQVQVVFYRLDIVEPTGSNVIHRFVPPKRSVGIQPGRQEPIGGDLSLEDIDVIIGQLSMYGLHAEKEISSLPDRPVIYLFNVDQPVRADSIREAMAHNAHCLTGQGRLRRESAAVAASIEIPSDGPVVVEYGQETEVEGISRMSDEGFQIPQKETDALSDPRRSKRVGAARGRR